MDHRFSKHEYFISCAITLIYTGLLAAAYYDTTTCPYSFKETEAQPAGRGGTVACFGGPNAPCEARPTATMRSLLSALTQYNGLTCHMIDVAIWIYILGLVIFMGHKYITYRMQGLHYFFLDYCYFHSATLVMFLLWHLVEVRWSEQPLVSWAVYMPDSWTLNYGRATSNSSSSSSGGGGATGSSSSSSSWGSGVEGAFRHPILTTEGRGRRNLAKAAVVTAAKDGAASFLDGLYYPVGVDVLTVGYVVNTMSADAVLSTFVVFFTLLSGSFGPILGAILMWRNALLFHSFDRMSSCYLHLLPSIIQGMLLHSIFTAARRDILSSSPSELYERATKLAAHFHEPLHNFLPEAAVAALARMPLTHKGQALTEEERFARYAAKHPFEAFCGEGTMCYELGHNVTYWSLLKLHIYMFLVWELVYNAFSEGRRLQRTHKAQRRRMREVAKQQAEFMQLTGASAEDAELLRPSLVLSEGLLGDPATRVTAYTWMMEHPPGGKRGFLYRFVTCLGTGRFPTTLLFQFTQLLLHVGFFTCCYPILYLAFHVTFSAGPLLVYTTVFVLITVYNAACMNKKWIGKLQRMATAGMEAERQRQSFAAEKKED